MTDEPETTAPADAEPAALEPVELELLTVRPKAPLAGRTLRMRRPSVGFWIAMKRKAVDDETFWEEIVDAIEDHDLGRDPAKLPPRAVNAIGEAWLEAMKEAAVPQA